MTDHRPVDLQRVRHVPGEWLRGRDLRDQISAGAHLQWWHNRALHDAVGVSTGFGVALAAGDTAVVVQPGVGYDCFGRELVLLQPRTVALPAGQQPMMLVACRGDRSPTELRWLPAGLVDPHECVALAELSYVGSAPAVRPAGARARPLARPRIGYGATPAGDTPWDTWRFSVFEEYPQVLGLQVRIDTTPAGFTELPCYFAWLQWPNVAASRLAYLAYVALGFQYIEEPTPEGFVFRVVLPPEALRFNDIDRRLRFRASASADQDTVLGVARGQRLAVCWLGIQSEPGGAHAEGV